MKLSWDEAKRQATIEERALDFASAEALFNGLNYTVEDARKDYGEQRYISVGSISRRLCVVVWTPRGSNDILFR